MPEIPAKCTRCGHIFTPAGGIRMANVKNANLSGNTTLCPKCGGVANFIEGKFTITSDTIIPIEAPAITHEILARIQSVVDEAKSKASDSDALIDAIEQVSPVFATLLRPLAKYKTPAIIIAVIYLMLSSIHLNLEVHGKIDLNEILAAALASVENTASPKHQNVSQTRPQKIEGSHRHRLLQPQLRPKKKQGKIGPRWRLKRTHPFV